jgi:hypothetical protein
VLLYRIASFWLVALAGWLIMFRLRRPRAHRGPSPSRRNAHEQDTAMAANLLPHQATFARSTMRRSRSS